MLWLLLLLLMAALGVLWWRFAMPASAGADVVPPPLEGNHPSLRTRHYRLADFHPAPLEVPMVASGPDEEVAPPEPTVTPPSIAEAAAPEAAPTPVAARAASEATDAPAEAGRLPEGALHNYLSAPAPTATDEHNRGVELTAAQRRAKMRELMSTALENRRAAPATA
ncbi:hypothetical protein GCM10023185_33460 [Hymenobacter saemangeumensis]|uniref:Conjugal transfer protein n=1 Tax=Hymenobacter saemangeumensis TaxID=1084522 RepID=A0ABP8INC7_9BACT